MHSDPQLRTWRAFLRAHSRVTDLLEAELQAEKGLSLSWYDVLVQLEEAEGHRLRMTALAANVLLSKSGLTRLVDRMCEAGLVSREADEDDRRGRWVYLTGAGEERLRDAAVTHLRGVRRHFTSLLTAEAAATMAAALEAVAESAERVLRDGGRA